jgi:hypothetical protein
MSSQLSKIVDARLAVADAMKHRRDAANALEDRDYREVRLAHARCHRSLKEASAHLRDLIDQDAEDDEGTGDFGADRWRRLLSNNARA